MTFAREVSIVWPPDGRAAVYVAALVLLVVAIPCVVVSLVLLLLRRKLYPLPGRGVSFLVVTCVATMVAVLVDSSVSMFYPRTGPPCVILFWVSSIDFLLANLCAARGWIFVFRVVIMNFLDEEQWQNDQRGRSQRHMTPSPWSRWFLVHRRYMSANYIGTALFAVHLVAFAIMGAMGNPDSERTREELMAGFVATNSTYTDSAIDSYAIANSTCPNPSMRSLFGYIVMFAVSGPCVLAETIIIWVCSRQTTRRRKEREAWVLVRSGLVPVAIAGDSDGRVVDVTDASRMWNSYLMLLASAFVLMLIFVTDATNRRWTLVLKGCGAVVQWFLSVVLPLYSSFEFDGRRDNNNAGASQPDIMDSAYEARYSNVAMLMRDPRGYQLFLDHLRSEYNSENALFWKDAQIFSESAAAAAAATPSSLLALKQEAIYIFDQYIGANAPKQINLPWPEVLALEARLQTLVGWDARAADAAVACPVSLVSFFSAPCMTICRLLQNDCLPRFRRTARFRLLVGG